MNPFWRTKPSWVVLSTLALCALVMAAEVDPDFDAAIASALNDPEKRQALQTECLETLLSPDLVWEQRYRACRILAMIGTEESVDPLRALLLDPKSSHLARIALEPMPYPAVDSALRAALEETSGQVQIGIMASIQHRRDEQAVDALSLLLSQSDVEAASAACLALGHIGTIEAAATLIPWLDAEEPLRTAAAEACLIASERMLQDGASIQGWPLVIDRLQRKPWPRQIRAGAFRLLLLMEPDRAAKRVLDTMKGQDFLLAGLSVACIAELQGDVVTEDFLTELPGLPLALQVSLLEVLLERQDSVSLNHLHGLLESPNESVRLTAIRWIGEQGDFTSVEPLCLALDRNPGRSETQALLETLRRLQGPNVQEALLSAMREGSTHRCAGLIDVLARRNVTEAWSSMIDRLDDPSLRPVVIKALGDLACLEHIPALFDLLDTTHDDTTRARIESALLTAIRRTSQQEGSFQVKEAYYGLMPEGPWKNVTDIVQAHVVEGQLNIDASNQVFGDPVPNQVKTLRVGYIENGIPGRIEAIEGQTLTKSFQGVLPEIMELFRESLNRKDIPARILSSLRVLGRLAGPEAYELIIERTNDQEVLIRDAAIRALADWPDLRAVHALVNIAGITEEITHRVLSIRGSVRLLRQALLPEPQTLALYDRLIDAAQTVDERLLILSGLSVVIHPATLAPIRSLHDLEEARTESELALQQIESSLGIQDGFVDLFDGTSLEGWTGEPGLWQVEEGCLLGQTRPEQPLSKNTFLIWEGGEPEDFELKFRYRMDSKWVNSGIQIRSERLDGHRVKGYQPDIAREDWITGICYEEGGRGILARRGEHVTYDSQGERHVVRFAEEKDLGDLIHPEDWNDYHVVAWKDTIITRINGRVMHAVTDTSPHARRHGVLAFQLHTGPPMRILFKEIALRTLSTADSTQKSNEGILP